MKIIYFNMCAIAILLIMLLSIFYRKMNRGKDNVSFIFVILTSIVSTSFLLWANFLDNAGEGNHLAKFIAHGGFLFFHALNSVPYIFYILSITDTLYKFLKDKIKVLLFSLPGIFYIILMIINMFTKTIFYIDENDVYQHCEPLFYLSYIPSIFYLGLGIYSLIRCRKIFTFKVLVTILIPYPLIIFASLIELFYPRINIEMFLNAIALLFVYANIQRFENLKDLNTNLKNITAYRGLIKKIFFNKKTTKQITINIKNYRKLKRILGLDYQENFEEDISKTITSIVKSNKANFAELCYLNNGLFIVILSEIDFNKEKNITEQLLKMLNHTFIYGKVEVEPITTICVIDMPNDVDNYDSLESVNTNLLEALPIGKITYAKDILKENHYKILLDIDRIIEDALANNYFEVYYQPIYSIKKKCFNSAEALLRLKHPKYGFISPGIFIPQAEKSGAIHRIGNLVTEQVAKFIASKEFKELNLDYIEMNLSAAQCMQDNLAESILAILDKYNIDKNKLNIEITETALIESEKTVTTNLDELHSKGISLSIDDFGSGYSNLKRLTEFPIDIVKFDNEFIGTINETSNASSTILEGLVTSLRSIGYKIVAEGVEEKKQLDKLKEMNCDFIQGFYFSKAIPSKEFINFIKERNAI